ncbi:uncharacterized protein LOC106011988 [Aplysia californica]|uniref:Uncharacterized protein LOC106011988 n=1 Tax=Aplysia californica TaxID=6500 RepID=A0ABM1A1G6_APLCA|nr:uncharacterized protein LOC106011988 [Aplysia californica]
MLAGRGSTSSSNSNISTTTRMSLEHLPDVVLGQILSYLHWKEKEWLLDVFPDVERVMRSPLAWPHFENDRAYAVEKLCMYIYFPMMVASELQVIRTYGRYFRSCTIWLHKLSSSDDKKEDDFSLLTAVGQHCTQLRAIHVIHPSDVSVSQLCDANDRYLRQIKTAALRKHGSFTLSLSRLFYTSIDTVESGILNYMSYLGEHCLVHTLVSLDFSHGLVFEGKVKVVHELRQCTNLCVLKCPIQCVNTSVVKSLSGGKLQALYLVSDDHTSHTDYREKLSLDWESICRGLSVSQRASLEVHYIFRNRTLSHEDMAHNPFVQSLVFDNLSSSISAVFLKKIADLYGHTLQTLAFCSHYWEFLMHFTDLEQIDNSFKYMATKCLRLTAFLSCLCLPSSALVNLAENSPALSTLRVFQENVRLATSDKPDRKFRHRMGRALGLSSWSMLRKGDNIYRVPRVDCRLLFANCFNEI